MRARIFGLALALLALAGSGGCGSAFTDPPRDWLPPPPSAQSDVYGGWISIVPAEGRGRLVGEFIAVDPDSVYVLNGWGLQAIARERVRKARVSGYQKDGGLSNWTALGTTSTLSHGYGLVLSLPLWIIVGTASSGGYSRECSLEYPREPWEEMAAFARFPLGPPAGMREIRLGERTFLDWDKLASRNREVKTPE
ncbi:MAG: hypothetical protein AB7V45_02685 [Candidatus Krumholzibacteriia bacterium]